MFDRRRPDPAQGVFETLLVVDGHPVELEAHIARLEASLETLFPNHSLPPLDVPVERGPYGPLSTGTVDGHGLGALRISVTPGGDGELEAQIERREARTVLRAAEAKPALGSKPISLHSLAIPGGLGAHKWADRSLLDEAQAKLPEGALPILVDEDGSVLEAARANVFAVRDGRLLTPPTDGRILPGVTRMRVLEIAAGLGVETAETALSSGDLLAADEVFLTGSVRGIEPALSLDGAPLGHEGEISRRLAAELRRAWAGATTAS